MMGECLRGFLMVNHKFVAWEQEQQRVFWLTPRQEFDGDQNEKRPRVNVLIDALGVDTCVFYQSSGDHMPAMFNQL